MDSENDTRTLDQPTLSRPRGSAGSVRMYALLAIISLAGVFIALLCTTRYGVGTSQDSSAYISAARSFLAGKGYLTADGAPYCHYPPLFPTLIAIGTLPGLDALDAARFLNALAFGCIIFISGQLFRMCTKSWAFTVIGALSVALSGQLLDISTMAWSDAVFVLLTLLFILSATRFLRTRSATSLVLVSLMAGLACLERYVGVTLIPAGGLLIGLGTSKTPLLRRLRSLACFSLISAGPIAAWLIRNRVRTGRTAGDHHFHLSSLDGLGRALITAMNVLAEWFVPGSGSIETRELPHIHPTYLMQWFGSGHESSPVRVVGMAVVVLFAAAAVLRSRRHRTDSDRMTVTPVGPAAVFVLTFLGFLIVYSLGISWDLFTHRHFVPAYIPIVLLAIVGIQNVSTLLGSRLAHPAAGRFLGLLLCVLWLLYPLDNAQSHVRYCIKHGAGGYTSAVWQDSPLVAWLRSHPLQGRVYSNAAGAFYLLTGADVEMTPFHYADATQFAQRMSLQTSYIVWFREHSRKYLLDLRELISRYEMETIVDLPDGAVYRASGALRPQPWIWAVYRFWSPRTGAHYYTLDKQERDRLREQPSAMWLYEDAAFYAFAKEQPGTGPVYCLRSARSNGYCYTMSEAEKDRLMGDRSGAWTYENIAFYAYPEKLMDGLSPVYHLWSETLQRDFYTISESEKAKVIEDTSNHWTDEGIAWYAYEP